MDHTDLDRLNFGDYVALHFSTLRKVDVMAALAERAESRNLRTRSSWWERNGSSIVGAVEAVTDHWIVRIAGLVAIAITLMVLFT